MKETTMKHLVCTTTAVLLMLIQGVLFAQEDCFGPTQGNEVYNCDTSGDPSAPSPCCTVWDACNGPYSGCQSYDPDFSATGGCNLACTPIDSGVLVLLLGGAAFGGMMIMRRREHATQIIR